MCLDWMRWMLLTLRSVVRVVSVVSLLFSVPQWGEEDGNFRLRLQVGIVDCRGGCCRLLCSFVGGVCRFTHLSSLLTEFLDGRRCSNCGLSYFCSTFVYTPYRTLYSCFPFRSWRKFLLVSTMFWTIRVHFGLSPTNAGVHPARQAMAVSTPRTRSMTASRVRMLFGVFLFQPQGQNQVWPELIKFWGRYISQLCSLYSLSADPTESTVYSSSVLWCHMFVWLSAVP
jgi:hypothetical protein